MSENINLKSIKDRLENLPKVTINEKEASYEGEPGIKNYKASISDEDGKEIGTLEYGIRDTTKTLFIQFLGIIKKKMGYGQATLIELHEKFPNLDINSGPITSNDGLALKGKLIDLDVARNNFSGAGFTIPSKENEE